MPSPYAVRDICSSRRLAPHLELDWSRALVFVVALQKRFTVNGFEDFFIFLFFLTRAARCRGSRATAFYKTAVALNHRYVFHDIHGRYCFPRSSWSNQQTARDKNKVSRTVVCYSTWPMTIGGAVC